MRYADSAVSSDPGPLLGKLVEVPERYRRLQSRDSAEKPETSLHLNHSFRSETTRGSIPLLGAATRSGFTRRLADIGRRAGDGTGLLPGGHRTATRYLRGLAPDDWVVGGASGRVDLRIAVGGLQGGGQRLSLSFEERGRRFYPAMPRPRNYADGGAAQEGTVEADME